MQAQRTISITILSAWHGLAVLPVFLSVVQPASYSDLRKKLGGGDDMPSHLHATF